MSSEKSVWTPANVVTCVRIAFIPVFMVVALAAEVSANGLAFLDKLRLEGHDGKGEALKSNVEFLKKKTERILRF